MLEQAIGRHAPRKTPPDTPSDCSLTRRDETDVLNGESDCVYQQLLDDSQELGLYDTCETASPGPNGISESQAAEILRRSEAYHRNPEIAVPLKEALERIERSLDDLHEDTSKLDGLLA